MLFLWDYRVSHLKDLLNLCADMTVMLSISQLGLDLNFALGYLGYILNINKPLFHLDQALP